MGTVDKDGFILVKSKGRKLKGRKRHAPHFGCQDEIDDGTDRQNLDRTAFRRKLNEDKRVLNSSGFWRKFESSVRAEDEIENYGQPPSYPDNDKSSDDGIPPIESLVCYGIGHVGSSRIARMQYAHFLLIKERLQRRTKGERHVDSFLFDPVSVGNYAAH